mgnify:CR=1 FL=1
MTAGGQMREQELMASLQMLLEKVEKGQLTLGPGKDNMSSRYFACEIPLGMAACGELAVRPRGERRVEILLVPYWDKLRPCQP